MRYKSSSCPELLTNLLAFGHAGMFRVFGKVTNPEQSIIGSPPIGKPAVPLGDSEMAAGEF
jgi:hypothetical protein